MDVGRSNVNNNSGQSVGGSTNQSESQAMVGTKQGQFDTSQAMVGTKQATAKQIESKPVQFVGQLSGNVLEKSPYMTTNRPSPISVNVRADMYKPVQPLEYNHPTKLEDEEEFASPYRYEITKHWNDIQGFERWPEVYRKTYIVMWQNPNMELKDIANLSGFDEDTVNYVVDYFVNNNMTKATDNESILNLSIEEEPRYEKESKSIKKRKSPKKEKTKEYYSSESVSSI